jgi:hypothetical protein
MWGFLPVFFMGPREAAPGRPAGIICIMLMAKLNCQTYFVENFPALPDVGSVLALQPCIEKLFANTKVCECFMLDGADRSIFQ